VLRRSRLVSTVAVAIFCAALVIAGCGEDESGGKQAIGACETPSEVPGQITDLSATNCDQAGEVAAGYFSQGVVPEAWTCTPYAGNREAVQCFQGGCEPPPDSDAQTQLAPSFFVDLDDGTSKDDYKHVRTCEPL
jgi:hypothetical protein